MSDCIELPGTISILEKINRLTQLFDPWLMPIDLIQFYAQNLGYEVGLNRQEFPTVDSLDPVQAQIEANKFLRFMTSQLPEWYKIKTSRPSLKVMLYSFGLVGDVVYYYTKNYADKFGALLESQDLSNAEKEFYNKLNNAGYFSYKEVYADICKLQINVIELKNTLEADWILTKWNPKSVQEDVSNIPDEFYPTPHFRLWFNLLESIDSLHYSADVSRHDQMARAIMAIRPLNTVFEGITTYTKVEADVYIQPKVRYRKSIFLSSDADHPADAWALT